MLALFPSTIRESTVSHLPRRVAAFALCCAMLGACTNGFLYNRLDSLAYLYFSQKVSLESAQADALKASLAQLLDWHRETELPRYIALLESLTAETREPLSAVQIEATRRAVEALWQDFVLRSAPDAANWLASLDPQQRAELFESYAKKDEDVREEYCDVAPAKLARERQKQFIDSVESWTGRLTAAQQELVAGRLASLPPTSCGWALNRIRFREAVAAMVERESGRPGFAESLTRLLSDPGAAWTPQYRSEFEASQATIVDLLAELDVTLSPAQRARRSEKLAGLATELRRIARKSTVAKS